MALTVGARLGPYEIVAQIGAGGMGEVYRARDTKLDREVAIKVLPTALAEHPDRLARFEREAKVLAALKHPNIAVIYGLEDRAIVMELIEGPTLADRLKAGPLPLEETLAIAQQIIAALEAAHDKGVVHRDLKPANVKAPEDGTVKVLDFGLATAVQVSAEEPGDPENSPTLTLGATQVGAILGTAAYMAPEQAAGRKVDKRADIWSFGVVLWEMLTGERLFHGGEDVAHTLADVLRAEIDFGKLPPTTPATVVELLKRCLDRDPKTRLRDIGEARVAIGRVGQVPDVPDLPPPSRARLVRLWPSVVVMLAVALVVTGWGWWSATRPVARPLMRFTDDLGAEVSFSAFGSAVAISPDGLRLAFVSPGSDGKTHLYLRRLESSKSTVVAGTEGVSTAFFSPDGQWIAFFADQKLKKISVEGGAAVSLCDAPAPRGGFWGEDNNILFAVNARDPISRISASGGNPQAVTALDKQNGDLSHRFPQMLPGGEPFLFNASPDITSTEDASIQVQSSKTGKPKNLVKGGYFGRYLATSNGAGYLIYMHGGTVFAAPMDLRRLELTGPSVPVIEDATSSARTGSVNLDFTSSGTLVYVPGSNALTQVSTFWLDASGIPQPLPLGSASYLNPRISPDGTRIAVRVMEGTSANLAVYESARNRMNRLTFLKGTVGIYATWSPDGKHLVFPIDSQELSGPGIYWTRADGAGEPQRLLEGQNFNPSSFSPDGKHLAYSRNAEPSGLWTLPLDLTDPEHPKPGKPELFVSVGKSELRNAAFSPDGRWIGYASGESGHFEIYVRPFPGPGGRWQVSTSGGELMVWSRNGREMFYRASSAGRIWVASYTAKGDSFAPGQPRLWSEKAPGVTSGSFDIMPDGKRFVVNLPASTGTSEVKPTHVTFLLNFADELRRRAPEGK